MLSNFAYTPQCLGSLISGRVVDCRRRSESSDRTPPSNGLRDRSANLSNSTDTSEVFVMRRMVSWRCSKCGATFERATSGARVYSFCSRRCSSSRIRQAMEERFWAKVDKNGPVPQHMPHLGQCWIWTAGTGDEGYGQLCVDGRMRRAHRVSWEMQVGPIQEDKPCVLHHCDNRACVRPAHLWAGTLLDNCRDMDRKGRRGTATGDRNGTHTHPERVARGDRSAARMHPESRARGDRSGARTHPECVPRGESHPCAKLTVAVIMDCRARLMNGESVSSLARTTGVARATIRRAMRGITWKHLPGFVVTEPETGRE